MKRGAEVDGLAGVGVLDVDLQAVRGVHEVLVSDGLPFGGGARADEIEGCVGRCANDDPSHVRAKHAEQLGVVVGDLVALGQASATVAFVGDHDGQEGRALAHEAGVGVGVGAGEQRLPFIVTNRDVVETRLGRIGDRAAHGKERGLEPLLCRRAAVVLPVALTTQTVEVAGGDLGGRNITGAAAAAGDGAGREASGLAEQILDELHVEAIFAAFEHFVLVGPDQVALLGIDVGGGDAKLVVQIRRPVLAVVDVVSDRVAEAFADGGVFELGQFADEVAKVHRQRRGIGGHRL